MNSQSEIRFTNDRIDTTVWSEGYFQDQAGQEERVKEIKTENRALSARGVAS